VKNILMRQRFLKVLVLCFCIGVIGFIGLRIFRPSVPKYLSPFITSRDSTPLSSLDSQSYVVYGFAPFWNLQKTTVQPELTHLAYFSLPMTVDGELDGIIPGKRTTSSIRWNSKLIDETLQEMQPNQKLTIVFTQFDNQSIRTLLSTPSAQLRLQESITTLLEESERPITGFNYDIEYTGQVTPELRQLYTNLIQKTRQTLDNYAAKHGTERLELSISLFPGAAKRQWIWDVEAMAPLVDHFIVMTYDFHRPSSPVAGPVAPVFGGRKNWNSDIVVHLKEFLDVVPAEKVILGVPFYGYEWETTTGDPRSPVFPGTGSTASYSRVQKLLQQSEELGIQQGWDEDALSPYLTYVQGGRSHVIYYENARSLGYKLDLVTGLRLGGVAIWALGYEEHSREPWDIIQQKLTK
jgi:spore germination protein